MAAPYPKSQQLARGERRYHRKVASPAQWQRIVAAKRGPCRICSRDGWTIEYHHLLARIHGGDDVADNMVPLCRNCHANVTQGWSTALEALAANLTDAEYAYLIGKLGGDAPLRLFGVKR